MKHLKYLSISSMVIVMTMVFLGCNNNTNVIIVEIETFPKEYLVDGAKKFAKEIGCPYQLMVCDSILICIDYCNEKWLYLYDMERDSLIDGFFRHGNGPYEFPDVPWITNAWVDDSGDGYFSLADQTSSTIYIYSIDSLLSGSREPSKMYKLPSTIPSKIAMRLNDSIWCGNTYRQEGSLFLYNWNQESVIKWKERVSLDFYVHPKNHHSVTYEPMMINRESGIVVSSLQYLKRIHIYNSELELTHIIRDKEPPSYPDFSRLNMPPETILYYEEPILSGKYIGVINYQYSREHQPGTKLLIFDYHGNPLIKYTFDQPFSCATIDWDKKTIYCKSQIDYQVMQYDLKGLQ